MKKIKSLPLLKKTNIEKNEFYNYQKEEVNYNINKINKGKYNNDYFNKRHEILKIKQLKKIQIDAQKKNDKPNLRNNANMNNPDHVKYKLKFQIFNNKFEKKPNDDDFYSKRKN